MKLKKPKPNEQLDELDKYEEELKNKTLFELKNIDDSRKKIVSEQDIKNADDVSIYKSMLLLQEFHRRLHIPLDPIAKSSIEMYSKMCRRYMA
jgi:hypothetical protein